MCFSVAAAPSTREQVNKQINRITIERVGNLKDFNLDEVMRVLSKASNNKINFLYLPPLPKPKADLFLPPTNNVPQFNGVNPMMGLPPFPQQFNLVLPPKQQNKIPKIKIMTGQLKNLTIKQLMDVIVMGCQPPVQYVIMDYGVIFLPQEDEKKAYMPTRLFRLNGNPFRVDK